MWFTETEGMQVGRITPNGDITQFHTPTTTQLFGRTPGGITTGPDHALWFAEGGDGGDQGRIARMTTSGAFHDYPLAQNSQTPTTVVTGPDGALWYTEFGDNTGRITVAGAESEFPLSGDLLAATMSSAPTRRCGLARIRKTTVAILAGWYKRSKKSLKRGISAT